MTPNHASRVAALLGFLGVALGAFGAHGLSARFALYPAAAVWWEKAVFYHLLHAVVMLLVASLRPFRVTPWTLFGAGILLFSGSLYLLALTGAPFLGKFFPPLGGLCFLCGWVSLVVKPPGGQITTGI